MTSSPALPLRLALALVACAAGAAAPAAPIGFAFASEGYSHPRANFSSAAAADSLRALAATGATLASVVVSAYVDSPAATAVHGIGAPSALRTAAPEELRALLALAAQLGLRVILAPTLDLDWDVPANAQAHAWYSAGSTSRSAIGSGIAPGDDAAWGALFSSFSSWLVEFAELAQDFAATPAPATPAACALLDSRGPGGGVVGFALGSELDGLWGQEARMRALAAQVRAAFPSGCLTASFTGASLARVAWLDALDVIGVDAYWTLSSTAYPLGEAAPVAELTAGWAQALQVMSAASAAANRSILVAATGAMSRPNCHLLPWGTGAPGQADGNDQGDESAWPCAYDMNCQANVYAAALAALQPNAASLGGWLAGIVFSRWTADPTAGGTGDNDSTPHGKPAEAVVRNATGALPPGCAARIGARGGVEVSGGAAGAPSPCDGGDAVVAAMQDLGATFVAEGRRAAASASAASAAAAGAATPSAPFSGFRGFVLGGPDEWSSPYYRLDSPGAAQSLRNMQSLGANSLELVVQWYFASVNATDAYAITDPSSPMRTSTDAEIVAFAALAKELGMEVILSPMLDPQWTLPDQLGCRDSHGKSNCFWRGQVGYFFPDAPLDCSASAAPQWAAWHEWYRGGFMLHYASLATTIGAKGLIIAHELDRPVTNCANEWASLLAAVRGVFPGAVSVAQGSGIFTAPAPTLAWIKTLDWLGVECYQGSFAAAPAQPWQDADLAALQAGALASLKDMAAFSASSGLKIACTEGGWLAAPWAAETGWGKQHDLADMSIHALDTWGPAQALAYSAFLSQIEAQPWYAGGFSWLWRADPTSGGTSDPSPTPWAKEASAAIAALWLSGADATVV